VIEKSGCKGTVNYLIKKKFLITRFSLVFCGKLPERRYETGTIIAGKHFFTG